MFNLSRYPPWRASGTMRPKVVAKTNVHMKGMHLHAQVGDLQPELNAKRLTRT